MLNLGWEGESYQTIDNEGDPDLYVKFINVVSSTSNNNNLKAVDENGSTFPPTSWESVSKISNCTGTCYNYDTHIISVDSTQYVGARMIALDSAQHMLEVYGGLLSNSVKYWIEPCTSCASYAYTLDRSTIKASQDKSVYGYVPPHELGHILQEQKLGQDYLRSDYSLNDPDEVHGFETEEYDSSSTTEGFADYVAAVSWWDPNNTSSIPIFPTYSQEDLENACPIANATCGSSGNAGSFEIQVARAFWDLDDLNNEAGCGSNGADDEYGYSTTTIANNWDYFADGTDNREDYEDDPNGVNMWDNYENNKNRYSTSIKNTFIYHNCIGNQEP